MSPAVGPSTIEPSATETSATETSTIEPGTIEKTGQTAPSIAVIDYGIGNLPSARKAFEAAGGAAFVSSNPAEILAADGVVLPGVGAMGRCMESLSQYGLTNLVLDLLESGRPFFGICVGMQMLHASSDEDGGVEGLGFFSARVVELDSSVKRPQMQWNVVGPPPDLTRRDAQPRIMNGVAGSWFYFVHSFAPEMHGDVVGVCDYGGQVASIVNRGPVVGTQFHPEKSANAGISLLRNFVSLASEPAKN